MPGYFLLPFLLMLHVLELRRYLHVYTFPLFAAILARKIMIIMMMAVMKYFQVLVGQIRAFKTILYFMDMHLRNMNSFERFGRVEAVRKGNSWILFILLPSPSFLFFLILPYSPFASFLSLAHFAWVTTWIGKVREGPPGKSCLGLCILCVVLIPSVSCWLGLVCVRVCTRHATCKRRKHIYEMGWQTFTFSISSF